MNIFRRLEGWLHRNLVASSGDWYRKEVAKVAHLPKTFSAVRIFDDGVGPIEIHLSPLVPKFAYPGVRQYAGWMVERALDEEPKRGAHDWPKIIREFDWRAAEPWVHVEWPSARRVA